MLKILRLRLQLSSSPMCVRYCILFVLLLHIQDIRSLRCRKCLSHGEGVLTAAATDGRTFTPQWRLGGQYV